MGTSISRTYTEPFPWNGEEVCAKFEDNYFAKGTSKYAFRGRITPVNNREFNGGEQCVVKLFKEKFIVWEENALKADKRASLKTKEMAERFNVTYNDKGIATIEVLIPIISKVKKIASHILPEYAMVTEGASVAIENFLQGRYVKFSNNFGYVNPDEDTLVPEAFSHFTFHESNCKILVTDLQGVYTQKSYVFTDPAIHNCTTIGHYGPTDLGKTGVIKFFQNHKCNRLCDGLRKPMAFGVQDIFPIIPYRPIDNGSFKPTYNIAITLVSGRHGEQLHRTRSTVELRPTIEFHYVGSLADRIQQLPNYFANELALSGRHGEQLHRTRTIGTQTKAAANVPSTMQQEAQVSAPSAATGPQTTDSNTRPGGVNAQPSLPEYGMDRNPGCTVINNNFNFILVGSSETRRESEKDKEPRLDDKTLHGIAMRLAGDWVTLALELGITIIKVKAIEKNYQNDITRQGLDMLVTWKQDQSTSDEQQMTTLCRALKKIGRADIVAFLHGK